MTLLFEPFESLLDFPRRLTQASGLARAFVPPADLVVTDDDVTVVMDVPGFTSDDLDIDLTDDVLTVRGERSYPYKTDEESRAFHHVERGFGKFERMLQVPKGLDPEKIAASLADGVLTLRIPKPEVRRPRRIEIAARGAQPAIEGQEAETQPEMAGATA